MATTSTQNVSNSVAKAEPVGQPNINPNSTNNVQTGSYVNQQGQVVNFAVGGDINKINSTSNVSTIQSNQGSYAVHTAGGQDVIRTLTGSGYTDVNTKTGETTRVSAQDLGLGSAQVEQAKVTNIQTPQGLVSIQPSGETSFVNKPVALQTNNPSIPNQPPSNASLVAQELINSSGDFITVGGKSYLNNPYDFNKFLGNQITNLQFEKSSIQGQQNALQNQFNVLTTQRESLSSRANSLNTGNPQDVAQFNADVNAYNQRLNALSGGSQITELQQRISGYNTKAEAVNLLAKATNITEERLNVGNKIQIDLINNGINFENMLGRTNPELFPSIPSGIKDINLTSPLANPVTKSTITSAGVNPNLLDKGSPFFPLSPAEQITVSAVTLGGSALTLGGFGELLAVPESAGISSATALGFKGSEAIFVGNTFTQVATGGIQGGTIYGVSKLFGASNKEALAYSTYGLVSPVGKIAGFSATGLGFTPLGASSLALESSLITGGIATYNVERQIPGGLNSFQGKLALVGGTGITFLEGYRAFASTYDLNVNLLKPQVQPQINVRATSYESAESKASANYPGAIDVKAVKGTIGSFRIENEEGLATIKSVTTGTGTVFDVQTFVSEPSESGTITFPSGAKVNYDLPNTVVRGLPAFKNGELVSSIFTNEGLSPYKSGLAENLGLSEMKIARTNIPARSVSGIPISSGINEFRPEEFGGLIEIKGLSVTSNSKIFFEGIESSTGETSLGVSTSGVNLKGDVLTLTRKGLILNPVTVEENTLVTSTGGVSGQVKNFVNLKNAGVSEGFNPFPNVKSSSNLIFQETNPGKSFEIVSTGERQAVVVRGIQGSVPQGYQELIRSLPSIQESGMSPARQVVLADIVRTESAFGSLTEARQVSLIGGSTSIASRTSSQLAFKPSIQVGIKTQPQVAFSPLELVSTKETNLNLNNLIKPGYLTQSRQINVQQEVLPAKEIQPVIKTNFKLESITTTEQQLQQLQQTQTQQLQINPFQPLPTVTGFPFTLPGNNSGGGAGGRDYLRIRGRKKKRGKARRTELPYTDLLSLDASFALTGKATPQSYKQRRREYYSPGNLGGIVLTKELSRAYRTGGFSRSKTPKLNIRIPKGLKIPRGNFGFGRGRKNRIGF